ncbi:MAG: peptide ABC transporter substrate-binding protein [Lacunisphaera sp.]|nr:peptide ABC transporter substrate-binding protein [Lacunisphaera sp.]
MGLCPGCSRREAPASSGQILRLAQRNEPATLDPQLATLPDEFFIIRALSEGLLTPDPAGGTPLPGAAASWEVSSDGLTYTFHLRPNAKWSNGDPVTAQDFVYSIHRALDRATAAPKASLFLGLRGAFQELTGIIDFPVPLGVTAPDPHTLVLTLTQPTADFPSFVASGPWIPVHRQSVEQHGRRWTSPLNYIGNGPFTLVDWKPNQRITVRKNPLYRDAAAVQLEAIQFLAFDSGDTEERAFRTGQVDVTMAVPFTKLATYRAEQPALLRSVPLHETRYLALNTTRPPLHDPRVRRALALVIDRVALVEKVVLSGRPALNFVPPGLGGYAPEAMITADSAEARRLLAAAGFPGGRGFPKLELATWPVNPAQLEAVQQMWARELGIAVTLAPREARTHLAALAAGDYDLAFMTAIPDYDGASDLFQRLTAGSPDNYPHWANADYDHLVAAAGRLDTVAARNAAYQQAEKVLLEEMPVIPLYFNVQNFLVSPAVKDWQADRLWTRFYRQVRLE